MIFTENVLIDGFNIQNNNVTVFSINMTLQ